MPKKTTFNDLPDEIVSKIIDYCVGHLDNKGLYDWHSYPHRPEIEEATSFNWQVKVDRLWRVSRRFQGCLYDILSDRLRDQPRDVKDNFEDDEKCFEEYHEALCDLIRSGGKDTDIADIVWKAPHLLAPEDPLVLDALPHWAWPVKYGCGNRGCGVQRCLLGKWLRALERLDDFKDAKRCKRWNAEMRCRRNFPDRRRLRGGRRLA